MSDAAAAVRHVILPWAPYEPAPGQKSAGSDGVRREARALRVGTERLGIGGQIPDRVFPPPHHDLHPRFAALGLPYHPPPAIPADDRSTLERDAVVSLGVALDVLSTLTDSIQPDRAVLAGFAESLSRVGTLGGIGPQAAERLILYAESPAGGSRATLCRTLAAVMAAAGESAIGETQECRPATPHSVGTAIRRMEAAARLVVRDATLLIEAHAPVDYWQA